MTEQDLLEAVVSAAREAYTHPGVTQSIMGPTDAELKWASDLVQRVRQHDVDAADAARARAGIPWASTQERA